MNIAHLHKSLFDVQGKIIRLKRAAKRQYGNRARNWPVSISAKYDRLKEQAKGIQQQIEAGHGV